MSQSRILVDRDIPWGIEAFEGLGDVVPYDAADLRKDPSILAEADVLACRSVTRVDAALLAAAPRLKAVATPVVGLDHVICEDMRAAQRQRGHTIQVFSAPGSTAAGVADWVVAAILHSLVPPERAGDRAVRRRDGFPQETLAAAEADSGRSNPYDADPRSLKVGIWGFGNCGRALAARLARLGMTFVAYDPPKESQTAGAFLSADLEDLWTCDVVSLHVPLTNPGDSRWPTRGMVDGTVFDALATGGVRLLCNTSRGAVLQDAGLRDRLSAGDGPALALDVYEDEPTPDPAIVAGTRIATAHVAGSVLEGRRKAVAKVRDEVRRTLRLPGPPFPAEPSGGFDRPPPFAVPTRPQLADVRDGIRAAVPLDEWTRTFRDAYLPAPPAQRAAAFEAARRGGLRREIRWGRLRLPD
jgi:erythronate-4-phosphate dehydrogenase